MPLICTLNATSDHGGRIVTSAAKTYYEGNLAARIGDELDCPIHGINPIIEGSSKTIVEGRKLARQGDHTACGAALISICTRSYDG